MSRSGARAAYLALGAFSFWTPSLLFQIFRSEAERFDAIWLTLALPLTLFAGFHLITHYTRKHAPHIPATLLTLLGLWISGPLIFLAGFVLSGNAALLTPDASNSASFLLFLLFFPFSILFLSGQGGYLPALIFGSLGVFILDRMRLREIASSDESKKSELVE